MNKSTSFYFYHISKNVEREKNCENYLKRSGNTYRDGFGEVGGGAGRRVRSVRSTRRAGFRAKVRRPSRGLVMSVLCSFRVGGNAISKFFSS